MKYLLSLFLFTCALAYNPYTDYVLCRWYQDKEPQRAESYCLRALEKEPTPTLYADLIRLEINLKKTERALSIANDFRSKYPDLPEPYLLLHSVHSVRGEQDRALSVLEEGYSKNPNSREIMLFLAEEYLKRSWTDRARNVLQNLASVSPDNPLPYFLLARIALSEGNLQEAIDFLQKSLGVVSTFEASFVTLGSIYEQQGEYSKAENLYIDILKQDPNNRSALERLGNLYLLSRRNEEAKEIYKRLADLYPEGGYLYQYGLLLIRSGEIEKAKETIEKLYTENPENPDVAFTYGLLLEMSKETDRALEIYLELRKKIGDNPKVLERLASIYSDRREYAKAEEILNLALSLEPNNFQLNLLMGNLLSEKEEYERALKFIDRAISINSGDYRGYFLRAIVHDKAGKIVSAEADLRKAMQLKPDDHELLNHLGYSLLLWYEGARLEEAERLIARALELDPENPAYIDSMAWVLYYKGEYSKAYELLLKALEKEKEDPVIYEHLGDVLVKLGQEEKAQDYYRKSYELLLSGKRGEPNQKERLQNKLKMR